MTLRHLAVLENYSTYIRATDECRKSQFYGSLKGTITGMRIRIEDSNRPKIIKKAYYAFMFGYVPKVSVIMHIYAVIPPGNSNHYVNQCKFANFRNGVHFGPVVWKLVVKEQSQVNVATPDLKEIITPVLQSKDKSFSTNVYLVFEWKEFQLGQLVKNYNHVMADHFVIEYEDKQTGMTSSSLYRLLLLLALICISKVNDVYKSPVTLSHSEQRLRIFSSILIKIPRNKQIQAT